MFAMVSGSQAVKLGEMLVVFEHGDPGCWAEQGPSHQHLLAPVRYPCCAHLLYEDIIMHRQFA